MLSVLGWGTHSLAPLSFKAATYSSLFTLLPILSGKGRQHQGEILREATKLVEAGKILPNVDPIRFNVKNGRGRPCAVERRSATGIGLRETPLDNGPAMTEMTISSCR